MEEVTLLQPEFAFYTSIVDEIKEVSSVKKIQIKWQAIWMLKSPKCDVLCFFDDSALFLQARFAIIDEHLEINSKDSIKLQNS